MAISAPKRDFGPEIKVFSPQIIVFVPKMDFLFNAKMRLSPRKRFFQLQNGGFQPQSKIFVL